MIKTKTLRSFTMFAFLATILMVSMNSSAIAPSYKTGRVASSYGYFDYAIGYRDNQLVSVNFKQAYAEIYLYSYAINGRFQVSIYQGGSLVYSSSQSVYQSFGWSYPGIFSQSNVLFSTPLSGRTFDVVMTFQADVHWSGGVSTYTVGSATIHVYASTIRL